MVGKIENLKFVEIEGHNFECLDGRVKVSSIMTPGGDAGEFILALDILEKITGSSLKTDQIEVLLINYL